MSPWYVKCEIAYRVYKSRKELSSPYVSIRIMKFLIYIGLLDDIHREIMEISKLFCWSPKLIVLHFGVFVQDYKLSRVHQHFWRSPTSYSFTEDEKNLQQFEPTQGRAPERGSWFAEVGLGPPNISSSPTQVTNIIKIN